MTPHDLLANFELLAEAPNGIQCLRELVLELAVRGKLVDQDPEDEPVSQLLRRIKTDKENLIRAKKIRAGKPLSQISEDEIPFHVPSSWAWVRLGDIGDWGAGATPTRGNSAFYSGGINWFKSGELNDDSLAGPSVETITALALSKFSLRENRPGDVLIALYGATIGKLAILDSPGTTNQAVCACTCFADSYNRYLFLFLMAWRRRFTAQGSGGAQPNISKEKVIATAFPLPPLPEQRRIVARVEELMALLGRLEAKRQEREAARSAARDSALAALREAPTPEDVETAWLRIQGRFHELFATPEDVEPLRALVLELAVRGKLVEQDPGDEAADSFLARLKNRDTHGNGRQNKTDPSRTYRPGEIPFDVPNGWVWERLGSIGETNIGLTYSPKDVSDVGIPVLRSGNVQNSKLDFKDLLRVGIKPKQSTMVQEGDLLICARNGSRALVGKVALVEGLEEPAAFGAFMTIFRSEINRYLFYFIRSPLFRQMIAEVNTTTINQITQNNLRTTLAPIPPLSEQRRIVARVNELMAILDNLSKTLSGQRDLGIAFAAAAVHHLDA